MLEILSVSPLVFILILATNAPPPSNTFPKPLNSSPTYTATISFVCIVPVIGYNCRV